MAWREPDLHLINVDKLTYASDKHFAEERERYTFVEADICEEARLQKLFWERQPDAVVHFAAESHVDRSIDAPADFIRTNIGGTFSLLEVTRRYWQELSSEEKGRFRFLHISTDEVYGSLGLEDPPFTEETPYAPNSPYAASKAAADHLVRAYHHTYGLPTLITHSSNNYGPYHFPEKLIPLMILQALEGSALPLYGNGQNVRDWIYVEDHCRALWHVLEKGRVGEVYNIGGGNEETNQRVVERICALLDEKIARPNGRSYREQIVYVADRPGHDVRYALESTKIKRELGWSPLESFATGMEKTVGWYLCNQEWCRKQQAESAYQRERLGQGERGK